MDEARLPEITWLGSRRERFPLLERRLACRSRARRPGFRQRERLAFPRQEWSLGFPLLGLLPGFLRPG